MQVSINNTMMLSLSLMVAMPYYHSSRTMSVPELLFPSLLEIVVMTIHNWLAESLPPPQQVT